MGFHAFRSTPSLPLALLLAAAIVGLVPAAEARADTHLAPNPNSGTITVSGGET